MTLKQIYWKTRGETEGRALAYSERIALGVHNGTSLKTERGCTQDGGAEIHCKLVQFKFSNYESLQPGSSTRIKFSTRCKTFGNSLCVTRFFLK